MGEAILFMLAAIGLTTVLHETYRLIMRAREWWRRTKHLHKGERPKTVLFTHEGATYDLADSLVRMPDSDGMAVWMAFGPTEITMNGMPVLDIEELPPYTTVAMAVAQLGNGDFRFIPPEAVKGVVKVPGGGFEYLDGLDDVGK